MRYASVCSGVEAASLAWMPLGWEPVWFSEIEPFPCEVLKQRFPGVQNLGDMTKIDGEKYAGTVDLLVGGTPCQGFSVAGKQGGLGDPRSALCLAYCRILETMRPRWFVWENVPGVFSTNDGEDFKAFLRKIDEIGYSCAWRVLDAQYIRVDGYPRAVPQRRRRVFVVGYLGEWRYPAEVLFEPGCLHRDSPPRRTPGEETPGGAGRGAQTADGRLWDESGVNPTLNQCSAGSGLIAASNQELFSQNFNWLVIESGKGFYSDSEVAQTLEAHEDQHRRNILCMAHGQANAEISEAVSPALTCDHEAPIAFSELAAPTLKAATSGSNQVPDVLQSATVRRLTPRECERLMGFPDDWTRIPWRGKPAEECPDSPRYKACGNSICVNVMRWIGMRIENVERKMR